MRYLFRFPDIGEGITEGKILEWYVDKGQDIKFGQPIVKMETDKVVTDIPSPKDGVIAKRIGKVGETINVEDVLVEIDIEGEDTHTENVEEEGAGVVGSLEIASSSAYLPASDEGSDLENHDMKKDRKALATPVARALAKDMNIDINEISGSGPAGRVMKEDILNYKKSEKPAQKISMPLETEDAVTIEDLPQIRKAIAKNMLKSKHNAPHMHVFDEAVIDELVGIRNRYKNQFEENGVKLSYLPFIVKATAMALKKHRSLNAELDLENGKIKYKNYINIGIAVDTPDGLLVPVIRNADKKSVFALAKEIGEIANKARDRKITLEDMKDGTFTITNFGSIGGRFAAPIINYPQAAILGAGKIFKKPIVKDDNIVVGTVLPISLGVDHAIVDGGEVTRFLNLILKYLGDPVSLIMD
ncbi:MAG: 2-oxo acid dehydrogenase subunit E2 [Candidatus Delongbacteria bacterium]|nr:2-oxo acid dehydrogenase subunit E2 [Candidatus Delongbacteria bacterium]MBN2834881.1 2-oxo acid dehydrogenase subunit E2 [Candidatus Delongbacteria bacterium]